MLLNNNATPTKKLLRALSLFLLGSFVASLAISCSTVETGTSSTSMTVTPADRSGLGSSGRVPSDVEGFPVPQDASLESLELGKSVPANDTVMDNADYDLPPGITVADVRGWYDKTQPPGSSYGEWSWCETVPFGNDSVYYWWAKPGTDMMLGLFIASGDPVGGLPTTAIRLTRENSGPC